jgi:hypothetical protein
MWREGEEIEHDLGGLVWFAIATMIGAGVCFVLAILFWLASETFAWPRDLDGAHANSPLKSWFDHLASGKGLCCSFADGVTVEDVDWDTGGTNKDTASEGGHYRVRLNKEWIVVPDAAVITEPNKFGPAVVWPYTDGSGQTQIRCFLPGAGS